MDHCSALFTYHSQCSFFGTLRRFLQLLEKLLGSFLSPPLWSVCSSSAKYSVLRTKYECVHLHIYFFKFSLEDIFIDLFLKRVGRQRNIDVRNFNWLPLLHTLTTDQTQNLGMCPDQAIKLTTFWCPGRHSNQLSHLAMAVHSFCFGWVLSSQSSPAISLLEIQPSSVTVF